MKFNNRDYCGRLTGPYTSEEAVELQVNKSLCDGQVERLSARIDALQGILGRLIDAMPVRSKQDREELARVIGYTWEATEG